MKRHLIALLAFLHGAPASAADRDPLSIPLREWLAWLGVAIAGGFVKWLMRVRKGEVLATQLFGLVGELACSALAGLLVWVVAEYFGAPKLMQVALVAMAGHMGAKTIEIFESWFDRETRKRLGIKAAAAPDERKGG